MPLLINEDIWFSEEFQVMGVARLHLHLMGVILNTQQLYVRSQVFTYFVDRRSRESWTLSLLPLYSLIAGPFRIVYAELKPNPSSRYSLSRMDALTTSFILYNVLLSAQPKLRISFDSYKYLDMDSEVFLGFINAIALYRLLPTFLL